jgi:hypothetical protein
MAEHIASATQRDTGARSMEGEMMRESHGRYWLSRRFSLFFVLTGPQQPFCLTLTTLASAYHFACIDRYVAARFRARRSWQPQPQQQQ